MNKWKKIKYAALTGALSAALLLSACGAKPMPLVPEIVPKEIPAADAATAPTEQPGEALWAGMDSLLAGATVLNEANATFSPEGEGVRVSNYTGPRDVTALKIPAAYEGKPVVAVGTGLLAGCDALKALSTPMPEGTSLATLFAPADPAREITDADNALYVPASLRYLEIDGDLPDFAVRGCRDLLAVRLKNADRLGHYALWGCSSLAALDLPEGLTFAGEEALAHTALSSLTIPAGVRTYGLGLLHGCVGLRELSLPLTEDFRLGYLFGARDVAWSADFMPADLWSVTLLQGDVRVSNLAAQALWGCTARVVTLPGGLETLGARSLSGCPNLREIHLPDTLTAIGDEAFFGDLRLTKVNLPDGLTGIGDRAFYDCVSLAQVELPAGLSRVGSLAFAGCRSLADISVPDGADLGDFAFAGSPCADRMPQ